MADEGSVGGEPPERGGGVRAAVLRGSALTLTMRWLSRLTGLVSTVILVRLLSPEDFGLVAMAMIVVGLVDVLSDTAVDLALIRHPKPDRTHFDSAWSVSALIGAGLALLLVAVASPAAAYFSEPRVEFIIYALSLKTLFVGLENIGVVWFRRDLDFVSEFRYTVARRIVPKFVTVGLAFIYEDYRALVYGEMIGSAFALALSYYVHPFRPWPNLSKVRELWSFSLWILVADLGDYLHLSVGRLVVGSVTNAATLGRFSIAEELAHLPETELMGPVARPLYPAYSKLYNDGDRLLGAYLNVLSVTAAVAAPTAVGMAIVAQDLLDVVLGAKWVSVAPTMTWLALACGAASVGDSVPPVLNALGKARRTAALTWTSYGALLTALAIAASQTSDIVTLAKVQAVVTVLVVPIYFLQLRRLLPFSWREVAGTIWRPLVAAGIMAVVILPTRLLTSELAAVVRLAFEVILGATAFSGVLLLLWISAGRPKGVEQIGTEILLQARERILKFARSR